MKKLWEKKQGSTLASVEKFTVGQDRDLDRMLAPFDVIGSLAHARMLESVGLLQADESEALQSGLRQIYSEIERGDFSLAPEVEDIHSQVELLLTERLGDAGKKIHMARSRNDQVLVDLKLFFRHELLDLSDSVEKLFELLSLQSEKFKSVLMPGYTHLQLAMPSSFGLWFGAYAESLTDDLIMLAAAYEVVNKNPLGSGAGFGSSFPIDRSLTTSLLGFDDLNYNVVYAQMGRGKSERVVAMGLANLAETLARMAMDACLFLNQNFNFIRFPDELTTGSSIMPHKKNPDVFELIRSRMNRLKALPNEILLMTTNLPSGYHRDLQILKEHLFPAFAEIKSCIEMTEMMFKKVEVSEDLLKDPKYLYLFSVEEVNRLVLSGVPFRDAYRQVGESIERNEFKISTLELNHTHEGSMGNLCLDKVQDAFRKVKARFDRSRVEAAFSQLFATSQKA